MFRSLFHFNASVLFLDRRVGGRETPVGNGYRPTLKLMGECWTSCVITSLCRDSEIMRLNEIHEVKIALPFWRQIEEHYSINLKKLFRKGRQIQLSEGSRIVAVGVTIG